MVGNFETNCKTGLGKLLVWSNILEKEYFSEQSYL